MDFEDELFGSNGFVVENYRNYQQFAALPEQNNEFSGALSRELITIGIEGNKSGIKCPQRASNAVVNDANETVIENNETNGETSAEVDSQDIWWLTKVDDLTVDQMAAQISPEFIEQILNPNYNLVVNSLDVNESSDEPNDLEPQPAEQWPQNNVPLAPIDDNEEQLEGSADMASNVSSNIILSTAISSAPSHVIALTTSITTVNPNCQPRAIIQESQPSTSAVIPADIPVVGHLSAVTPDGENTSASSLESRAKKKGRKSLESLGYSKEQIEVRRREQNKIAAKLSRKRKASEAFAQSNSTGARFITEAQYTQLRNVFEAVIANTYKGDIDCHMQYGLDLLLGLPQLRPNGKEN